MDAGKALINGVFNGSRLLEIPFYQRAYVWDEPQWERFLSDMVYISQTKRPYFLGSIILKERKTNTWDSISDIRTVIDGQQRLTTLVLFFKVLCLKMNRDDLFQRDFVLESGDASLRHGKNDVEAFNLALGAKEANRIEESGSGSQIIAAFNFFIENINTEDINRDLIKKYVQFVCIDVAEDEDEQLIFDTINSLGVRLTTAELLKNYFFNMDNISEYETHWESVFEKDEETKAYWDQEIVTGRIKRSLIDLFFDAYLQIAIQDGDRSVSAEDKIAFSKVEHLFKSYQDFVKDYCAGDKETLLLHLGEYAAEFTRLFHPEACDQLVTSMYGMDRINVIIFGLKTSTMIPYVLYLRHSIKDDAAFNEMLGILENYIMRRMVVRATTKNYNKLFESLILNKVLSPEALLSHLSGMDDASTYMPGDTELEHGFAESKLYNLQSRGILYLIESKIRPTNSSTALLGFNQYSLEHLLPKKWKNNWGSCATTELDRQRDRILLTLGNLAIIPQSLNASIRDADWATKKAGKGDRPGLDKCAAGLITMQDVLEKQDWNEQEIAQRASWLFEQAKQTWPETE